MVDDLIAPGRLPFAKKLNGFSLASGLGWTVAVGASLFLGFELQEVGLLDATKTTFIGHGFIWALGLGGIIFNRRRLAVEMEKRERAEARVRHLANHDELTSLPNRNLFFERLKRSIACSNRSGLPTALLCIDIDDFKTVNDRLGRDAGDRMLVEIAERLQASVRETDTVARIGGDEFAVVLSDLPNMEVVARIANQMLIDLNAPFRLPQDDVTFGASIGVSFYPEDGEGSRELLAIAGEAMREVKALGKNGFSFFSGRVSTFAPRPDRKLKRRAGAAR